MSPLSPKQDILLPSDHHKILPWPSLGPDDGDFNPDQYLNDPDDVDQGMLISADDILANGASDSQLSSYTTAADSQPEPPPSTTTTEPGPVTPVDGAEHPTQTHQSSPASVTDPTNALSPALQDGDRSSSLSPVPEPDQPPADQQNALQAEEQPRREEEEEEETSANNILSRLSTPLSPLSPPPQEEEEEELAGSNQDTASSEQKAANDHKDGASSQTNDGSSTSTNIPGNVNGVEGPQQQQKPQQQAEAINRLNTGTPGTDSSSAGVNNVSPALMQPLGLSTSLSTSSNPASSSPSNLRPSSAAGPSSTSTADGSGLESGDPKAALILELNLELIKICMVLQAKGVPPGDPTYRQYSQRLQMNLAWGAAAVDQGAPNNQNVSDPILEPPPPVDFAPTDRIRQIYVELGALFAKDLARRQSQVTLMTNHAAPNSAMAGSSPNPAGVMKPPLANLAPNPGISTLKRERPEEHGVDAVGNISKRQNTGDNKMMPPPSSIPISSAQPTPQNISTNTANGIGSMVPPTMNGINPAAPIGQGQSQNSMSAPQASSMPLQQQHAQMGMNPQSRSPQLGQQQQSRPPSQQSLTRHSPAAQQQPHQSHDPSPSPSSMMNLNVAEASMASAQRAKQLSVRSAQQQAASGHGVNRPIAPQGAQGMQPQQQPGQQQQPQPGNIGGGNMQQPQGNVGNMQTGPSGGVNLSNMPIQMQNAYNLLQNNPNHPFIQNVMMRVPGFRSLPLLAQLQKIVQMQMFMQQKQQDQQNQQQQQQNPMAGQVGVARGGVVGATPMQQSLSGMGTGPPIPGGMGAGGSTGGFSGSMGTSPSSPVVSQGGGMFQAGPAGQVQGGGMGPSAGGNAMDPRMLSGSMQAGPSGMNIAGMTPQSRQLYLLQQQARMGATGAGGMGINQNLAFAQQQQHQQQHQQQQHQQQQHQQQQAQLRQLQIAQQQAQLQSMQNMGTSGSGMAPQNMMGGGGNADFAAAIRSNPQVQGIARNAWSPTGDGNNSTPSPMTPRIGGGGGGVGNPQMRLSHEDYQRMMVQQQQMQAARVMTSSPAFGQGMNKWPTQQQTGQHQPPGGGMPMGMGMGGGAGGGMGQQGGSSYGMSPPGSAGGMSAGGGASMAPSPPGGQNWSGSAASGGYPFAGSPSQGMDHMRHMSGTPGPQQGGMGHGQMGGGMGGDAGRGGSIPNDFDLFNWNG